MKKSLSIFIVLAVVLVGSLTLSAQAKPLGDTVPTATPDPHVRLSGGADTQGSAPANPGIAGVSPQSACTNLLLDPSFEAGRLTNPYWSEYSYNFGTPLCTVAVCGTGGGTAGPRTGTVWGWFGGTSAVTETAQLVQTVTIPTDTATLSFYFWIGYAGAGSGADDVFYAGIGPTPVFTATALNISSYPSYKLVTVNISAFADGGAHDVVFEAFTSNQAVDFNLDDVNLCSFVASSKVYLPLARR